MRHGGDNVVCDNMVFFAGCCCGDVYLYVFN